MCVIRSVNKQTILQLENLEKLGYLPTLYDFDMGQIICNQDQLN